MRSTKESNLDTKLFLEILLNYNLSEEAKKGLNLLLADKELQATQEYANTVSIKRLGFNDHGPVHMRTVALNSIKMLELLKKAGIKTTLEIENGGDFEDSLIALIFASMLHDIGMGMGRNDHESHSVILALPFLDRFIPIIYSDIKKRVIIRTLIQECIVNHMGSKGVSSLEAGIVQVADGCDMTKGRARVPLSLGQAPRAGHIHQYSANSIEKVTIDSGKEKPIRIDVLMSNAAGYFQVEEVLMAKIANSTARPHIELYAQVQNEESKQYI